jgi:D-threo-aldose 1-dehydrogenase
MAASLAQHLRIDRERGAIIPKTRLQFPLGHPCIAAIVPGAVSPSEVERNADYIDLPIPQSLWDELKAEKLLAADVRVPNAGAT